jgi:uncharacterized RDD family membrane protein YckC
VAISLGVSLGAASGHDVRPTDSPRQLSALVLLSTAVYGPLLMRRKERNGQTLGKQVMRIRVVRDNGRPFGYVPALVREVGAKVVIDALVSLALPVLSGVFSVVDGLWPLRDRERRALHDMICSTHVVRVEA